MQENTITAICTPPGSGGVAMIRLSGPQSVEIAQKMFSKNILSAPSHHMLYGDFLNAQSLVVDSGLIVKMLAPNSYTGEDVVEIFCHGGALVTQKVLECSLIFGAKPAGPGEFTQRAFLNKKMDLTQAEAVQSLISAQSEAALKVAQNQLKGLLTQKIEAIQKKLVDQAGILEAWVDFPEEGIEFCTMEELCASLESSLAEINQLKDSYSEAKGLKEGFSLCLLGAPNVGKSSLMNQLLKKERAIVTPIAGTTRDIIEDVFVIDQVHYRIKDAAGIRSTPNLIEKEGVKRAFDAANKADLVLFVLDSSRPIEEHEKKLMKQISSLNVLYIWNKTDLPRASNPNIEKSIYVSAKKAEGLSKLRLKIKEHTLSKEITNETLFVTEKRHEEALSSASCALKKVIDSLISKHSPEWLTYDLKDALKSLQSIKGFDITECVLSSIFSRFCIGK